ncbi:hypothetical protein [Anaeromicropila populeti]|nr:hypothetical protein [Anaeromicropila populeti]
MLPLVGFGLYWALDSGGDKATFVTGIIMLVFLLTTFFCGGVFSYMMDIINKRIITVEGTLIELIFRKDYHGRYAPNGFEVYDIILEEEEKIRITIDHKMYRNEPKADRVRCILLEKSHEVLAVEVLSYANKKKTMKTDHENTKKRNKGKKRKR